MPFSAGDKLGPYEIVALISKGGMSEVYRAHDPRLGRDVAIKVSAERFSARFEREARAVAALNHPNICTLYDVGPNYLVMEYVEGENLKGPLALDEALRIARQIVDALEAAHEKRITHRDLKPANIKIKPDGLVKVLDFGLAKMHEPPGEDGDTVPLGMTEDGAILGTPSYMSPEQALGKKADKRSDIWAFGVVLYEMLTGQRLFKGKEMGDILESVVKDQPNLDAVPAKVKPLLERCLEKDPRKRLRDIGDVELLLADAPVARPARPLTRIVPWVIAAVLAVVAGAASWTAWHATPLSRPLMRLNVDLGPDVLVDAGFTATISPDGTRLVFLAGGRDGVRRIAVRPLDRTQATLLQGTENAGNPFFSPDSQWIGFSAQDKLQKISVQGGAAVTLCDSAGGATASWGEDGNIIASLGGTGGLFRIPDTGGTPQPVTKLENGEVTHRWPQVLPGAKAVLFTSSNSAVQFTNGRIEAMSFKTGEKKILVRGGYFGRYLPSNGSTGHLVYLQHGVLFAVPFDPVRLEIRGSAVAVLEDVAGVESVGAGHFGFSQTGAFVYALAGSGDSWSVLWLDSSGKTEPLLAKPGIYYNPRFSPDGLRLAMTVEGGKGNDIYVYDWKRDIMSRLTFTSQVDGYPTWTPDGKHLVFSSQDSGAYSIQWIRADGAGEAQPLLQGRNPVRPFSFSPMAAASHTKPLPTSGHCRST